MAASSHSITPEDRVADFLAKLCGMSREKFEAAGRQPELPVENIPHVATSMTGVMTLNNQPEFWADAPWRLEPDQAEIPVTMYIRDAAAVAPVSSPWRLDTIRIEQQLKSRRWQKLRTYLPADLPGIDGQGCVQPNFWVFSTRISKNILQSANPGESAHLRLVFEASTDPYEKSLSIERHLKVFFPEHPLPQGRVENAGRARKWFYGDTHYHSAYSNNIKEYGAPLPETRPAGLAVGLDWMVVTDHSCDLTLMDHLTSDKTRWDLLKAEVCSPELSDDRFRFILGEEITLVGNGEKYVHMLAIGGMQDVVQGAFLPEDSSSLVVDLWTNALKNIICLGKGFPVEQIESLFGRVHLFEQVLQMLPDSTLTFAAHPFDFAQVPPAKWDAKDLAHPRLTGYEFWNGRSRRSAKQNDRPFTGKGWTNPDTLKRRDGERIKRLLQLASEQWDPQLAAGIEEWALGTALPGRRPVFVGGSDAHGDFNYHAGIAWDYSKVDMIDDNGLGRVRTAIFLPENQSAAVPGVDQILDALKKGSCAVTDGPVLEASMHLQNQVAYMGDVLSVSGSDEPELRIAAHSTPEFGPVTQVEVLTYFKGQEPKEPTVLIVETGKSAFIQLAGEQGYCRLQAQTVGKDGERFCCFTNPIWVRVSDPPKRLRIRFLEA